jgi:hypothetical protein
MALTSACLQVGEWPPFKLIALPVRNVGGEGEVRLNGRWQPCPYRGEKPKVVSVRGMPVAGIATTWETEESYHNQLDLKVAQAIEALKEKSYEA